MQVLSCKGATESWFTVSKLASLCWGIGFWVIAAGCVRYVCCFFDLHLAFTVCILGSWKHVMTKKVVSFLPPNPQRVFIRPGLQVDGWKWEASIKPFRNGPWKFSLDYFRWWDRFVVWSTWRREREWSFKTYQNRASCADAGWKAYHILTLCHSILVETFPLFIYHLFFFQGVGHSDDKVLVLAATNTPYALDQVKKS